MWLPPEAKREYRFIERSLDNTPARYIDLTSWPKRESIRLPVTYCEWFDWAAIFVAQSEDRLLSVASQFSSTSIYFCCLLAEGAAKPPQILSIAEIDRKSFLEDFKNALWDKQSSPPEFAATTRIALIWDDTEKWIVLNDRFYEIGLLAVFDRSVRNATKCFFDCFNEQILLDRFSIILHTNKIDALSEVRRWFDAELQ